MDNIRKAFQNNAVQYNTTTNYDLSNKHTVELTTLGKFEQLAIICFVKVVYVVGLQLTIIFIID